jgi:8-oxo-dGDP phosphatase
MMTRPEPAGGHDYEVTASEEIYRGRVLTLRADRVRMPGGAEAVREVVANPGAVAVAAVDDEDRVVLIRQYRHPVGRALWELPAGLLDVAGEPADQTARRELFEEAHLAAARWDLLLDLNPSPGFTTEAIRVYLARGLSVPDAQRYAAEHEEADLVVRRFALDEAAGMVLAGEITNATAAAGVLAAARARDAGWTGLRPVPTPWPDRPDHV